jgi:hypothetical protein
MKDDEIILQLKSCLSSSHKNKSSYWSKHTKNEDFEDIYNILSSGTFFQNDFKKNILHFVFQFFLFNKKIFFSNEIKTYKKLCAQQNRMFDYDILRHVFTLNMLNKNNLIKDKVCVIGDGKANFVSGCLLQDEETKIYSINLPEVSIQEYSILMKFNIINKKFIKVVNSKEDLNEKNIRLFFVPAENAHLLENTNINLFVNIASFQEMNKNEIIKYFNIIKSNKAFLYCCNRERKELYDGIITEFDKYPWGDGRVKFNEKCPWFKKYYQFRPPFVKKFLPIKHCLIDYS